MIKLNLYIQMKNFIRLVFNRENKLFLLDNKSKI